MKSNFYIISNKLIELGHYDLADKVLCAYAAIKEEVATSYSAQMRKLRKEKSDKKELFQKTFKNAFDKSLDENLENSAEIALMQALKTIEE